MIVQPPGGGLDTKVVPTAEQQAATMKPGFKLALGEVGGAVHATKF